MCLERLAVSVDLDMFSSFRLHKQPVFGRRRNGRFLLRKRRYSQYFGIETTHFRHNYSPWIEVDFVAVDAQTLIRTRPWVPLFPRLLLSVAMGFVCIMSGMVAIVSLRSLIDGTTTLPAAILTSLLPLAMLLLVLWQYTSTRRRGLREHAAIIAFLQQLFAATPVDELLP